MAERIDSKRLLANGEPVPRMQLGSGGYVWRYGSAYFIAGGVTPVQRVRMKELLALAKNAD